jgi:hypothetical protein
MAQQTAVGALIEKIKIKDKQLYYEILDELEEANEIHKKQIKAAYNKGYQDGEIDSLDAKDGDVQYFEDAELYYNETYGTE